MILFCMLLMVVLPMISRAQVSRCTLDKVIPLVYEEKHESYNVIPILNCTSPGVMEVELGFDYPVNSLDKSRSQLFYECESPSGNVTYGEVINKRRIIRDKIYTVSLSEHGFNVSGTSCEVWGCYEENSEDNLNFFYPIDNVTCNFTAPTTQPITELATERPPAVSTTIVLKTSSSLETTTIPHSTPLMNPIPIPTTSISIATSLSPTGTLPVPTSTGTLPVPTRAEPSLVPTIILSPNPSNTSASTISVAVPVGIVIATALVCLSVLICIILRLQQVQRKKHSMMRYYDYREPIDPYFSPIDINARVKSVASLVSEFDILMPQTISSDSTDIERSQVLHGTNNSSDTCASSVKSIKFVEEPNGIERNSAETSQEQPPVDDSGSEELEKQYPQSNGYVTSTGTHNPGYVVDNFKTATIPIHIVQSQPPSGQANTRQRELCVGSNELYRTQLSICSLSSGYVTDLATPSSEYHKYPNPEASMVTLKITPALVSQYPVFDPVQTIDERLSEEENMDSVVYSFGDGMECDAVEVVTEHKCAESIIAECSLSLNPLHFEPINYDELVEQTSPSYVNTTPGAELYQTQQ